MYTKSIEKVEKIMKIQEYSKKFQLFPALLNVLFHMTLSNIRWAQKNFEKSSEFSLFMVELYVPSTEMIVSFRKSSLKNGQGKCGWFIERFSHSFRCVDFMYILPYFLQDFMVFHAARMADGPFAIFNSQSCPEICRVRIRWFFLMLDYNSVRLLTFWPMIVHIF